MANNTINNCTFGGYLGSTPKMMKTKEGKEYTALSIATTDEIYNKATKQKESFPTTWVSVLVFGGFAKVATQYLEKGAYVYVETSYRSVRRNVDDSVEFVNYFLLKDEKSALKFWNKRHDESMPDVIEDEGDGVSISDVEDVEQAIRGE